MSTIVQSSFKTKTAKVIFNKKLNQKIFYFFLKILNIYQRENYLFACECERCSSELTTQEDVTSDEDLEEDDSDEYEDIDEDEVDDDEESEDVNNKNNSILASNNEEKMEN